ncbi:hypothetical protein ACFXOI_22770 [Streptomyces bacillaris]
MPNLPELQEDPPGPAVMVMDPVRPVASWWATCSSVNSSAVPNMLSAALLMTTSKRPARLSVEMCPS